MSTHARDNRGFVLAATLWILAIMTIAVGYFAERVSRSLALAQQKQQAAEDLVAFANTRAQVLFRFATHYPNPQGLGLPEPVSLDDRAYRGAGGDIVHLQDNRGLLSVNFVEQTLMTRLLSQLGIPVATQDAMMDALRDYTDPDNLRRLNGAEAAEYEAAGLPPPPNDWLASPQQLQGVLGWREPWEKHRLMRYVTTVRVAGFNPNTAPMAVLASLPGVTVEVAATLVKHRRAEPLRQLAQLPGYVANLIESDYFIFFPGDSLRITQHSPRSPWAVQMSVTLTPESLVTPWRVDYFARTVVSYAIENEAEIQKLPPWTSLRRADAPPP